MKQLNQKNKRNLNLYLLIILAIGLLAVIARFLFLNYRPLHHDEGMLAYFAWDLAKYAKYTYTPQIHGPILFYVQAIIFNIFGDSSAAVKMGPAIFGVILALIPFIFTKTLGKKRAIFISLLLLISWMFLYYSRFLVHTSLVVVFWFLVVFNLRDFFLHLKPINLYLTALFLALAFGTSETSYIFIAVLLSFILPFFIFNRAQFFEYSKKFIQFVRRDPLVIINCLLMIILIWVIIYSVGFTNLKSLIISLPNPFDKQSGLGFWLAQHPVRLGGQPWYYYLILTIVYEPLALLACIWGLFYLPKNRSIFYLFLCWWTILTFLGFSIAGEKFPWLYLPSLLPLTIFAGYYLGGVWQKIKFFSKFLWLILIIFTMFISIHLVFFNSYNTKELAVYVQTPKYAEDRIMAVKKQCLGTKDCVAIDSSISWPLSWHLKDMSSLIYPQDISSNTNSKYIFVGQDNLAKIHLDNNWKQESFYLRDWWVPQTCLKSDCINKFLKYFLFRQAWNSQGGYTVYLFSRQ
ncbi:MAG: TIGR03663 family protein [Patescibacteria group bacterium]|nr:TIGR03663 family protein [Patescibacteria group bacterium]